MLSLDVLARRKGPTYSSQKQRINDNLLREVWGFTQPGKVPPSKRASCLYHYESLLSNPQLLDDHTTTLRTSDSQSSDVVGLVQMIRQNRHARIADIHDVIKARSPHWLVEDSRDVLNGVLQFGVQLWLFTKPNLSDLEVTLQEVVHQSLNKGAPAYGTLWREFSAKSLTRRGHFHIMYTSDIHEHLSFASKSVVRVFSHASVLERYETSADGQIYPPGLLFEVRRTLNLLWPVEDEKIAKHVYSLEMDQGVDIEAGMGHIEGYDLRQYPYFGERLAKLQERLEFEEQRHANSTTFKIAVWGIVLSALFGLISAVTGIMQVWVSLHTT